jgi:hypothetical protein
LQELQPERPMIQVITDHKDSIDNISEKLFQTRPAADGLAIGKRMPINCNVFARSNTKTLKNSTLP